ncbi:hypothetical protein ACHWQZ_G000340 [Mnemiopsis leidyi]
MPLYELGLGSEKIHVIIDIGSYHTKIGFAGEASPRHIIPSYNVKRNNEVVNICDPKLSKSELADELITFVHAIYFRYLLTNPKDRKVVICENFLQTELFRETLAEVLFKQFSVVGVMMTPALPLSLIPLGTPTGLVVNVGYHDTSVICVYEGMIILQSYLSVELGTHAHLMAVQRMISESGTVKVGSEMKKASELYDLDLSVLEDIRARTCFCGERPVELKDPAFTQSGVNTAHRASDMSYPMSDGYHLLVSGKIRERSVEVLYDGDGEDNSIATLVLDSLLKCPIDCRVELAGRILVIGGGSMLAGFDHRLKQELTALLEHPRFSKLSAGKLKFYKPNYFRNTMSWTGGAIMGSVEHLHDRYVSRDFYNAKGSATLPNWSSLAPQPKDSYQSTGTPSRRSSTPLRDFMSSPLSSSTLPPISNLSLS